MGRTKLILETTDDSQVTDLKTLQQNLSLLGIRKERSTKIIAEDCLN